MLDLDKWPTGSRVIIRRERPHPGAQLRFTDIDGPAGHASGTSCCAERSSARYNRPDVFRLIVDDRPKPHLVCLARTDPDWSSDQPVSTGG